MRVMGGVLKVGIVGSGGIAQSHLRAIQDNPDVGLAVVMDLDADRAEKATSVYGGRATTDFDDLLQDKDVQAVHICSPHAFHADQAVAAAAAGKHVLVEKPMALSVADCDRMIDTCEKAGVVLMVGQVLRHFPAHVKAREFIREGVVGSVGHMLRRRYSYFNPGAPGVTYPAWYADPVIGGDCILYCFGPHEYDIQPWLVDSPVVSVSSTGTTSTDIYPGQFDSRTSVMTHANGTVSVVSQSVVSHGYAGDQLIIGSKGSMLLTTGSLSLNGETVDVEPANVGMPRQIAEFARCCLHGGEPDANGRSVRASMAAIEAAKLSGERGEPVGVAELG